MLVPKIPIHVHLCKHIGHTIGYCGHCRNPIVAYNTYRWTPKPSYCAPRWVSILINLPTYCWPNSLFDRVLSRDKKELNGTQTGRSKTLQAWASHRTDINSNQHLVETIHLKLLGHNKDRQPCIRVFSAGLEGRAAWMMNGELELIVPRRAVFERLCSPTLKQ